MVDITEIKNGVFALTEYLPENIISVSSFLITGKTPAIIETGTPYLADGFLHAISDMVAPETISNIFITHEHLDHFGGLPEYVAEAYNASVVLHNFLKVQIGFMGVVKGIIPVNGGETIPIGDRKIEVIYAPVETTGTVIYLLKPEGILFTGDYFGQLGDRRFTPKEGVTTEKFVRDILVLHEGLGFDGDNIKKFLAPIRKKEFSIIAPSHGCMIMEDVDEIFNKVVNAKLDYREGISALRRIVGR
jgi:flavorubredoxin